MQLLMEHENAWPFMGTGAGDAQSASGRRLDLCGVVERLQVKTARVLLRRNRGYGVRDQNIE